MKKIISLILIILTLCIPLTTGFAAEASTDNMTEVMKSLNIMNGYTDGSMHLGDKLTRAQFAKIIINASKYKNSVSSKSTTSPFKDVSYSNWAAPYVGVAVQNSLIKGYPDATFKPNKNVTLEEAVTVALSVMGYTSDDFGSSWPYGQLSVATNIGLLKNVNASVGTEITRQTVMQIVYNMLNGKNKDGSVYIDNLGYSLLEDVILIATSADDSSIGSGKISTSSGIYKISDTFSEDNIGKKGNVILNSNDEIICFIPSNQQVTTYTAYAALDDDIVVASASGNTEALGLDESTTVYYKGEKTSVQNIVSKISVGDVVKVSESGGIIDFVVISGNKMEGPVIVNGTDWYSTLGIDASNVTVLRNGNIAAISDINTNDVIYYSESLNTLWAYNKKITGVYESASPNRDQPSSVTVSGNEYSLETIDAFNKLSSKGTFDIGDGVTLLLGKDGKVADVVSPTETNANVTGYLTQKGTKEVTNSSGYKYSVNYIKIATTDGDELEYQTGKDYSSLLNSVVTVKFSNGLAVLSKVSAGSLSGTFDWNNKKLGSTAIAKDVKIMDVGTVDADLSAEYIITYPQRINNVKISSTNILYYSKNDNGEIDSLILNNVTGDSLKYGIVTKANVTESEDGMSLSSAYECDINGSVMTTSRSKSAYTNISAGKPASFDVDNNSILSIKPLTVVSSTITGVNGIQIETSDGKTYLLSSGLVVYMKSSYNGYSTMPLSSIIDNDDYSIKAYYDKSESYGGRIRVIIATAN